MLRSAAGRAKALPVNQQKFERILSAIWWKGGNHPRLGLAISGGVDSMALASLCSRATILGRNRPSFTAFIVDHRLRQGSDIEAEKVAQVLEQININSQVLRLDWTGITDEPEHLENLESIARRLRFQALGRACRDSGINSLLLAHHGDDQAETVLSRLLTGYTGTGFRGIRSEAVIPECHGIYGVCESGSPHRLLPTTLGKYSSPFQIEHGGVQVYRPLLEFFKAELIATCEEDAVQWFEDPTNADRGLALRNTIRHVWANSQMPRALSPDAMIELARRVEERAEKREQEAVVLFSQCGIELDVRSGSLDLVVPAYLKTQLDVTEDNPESSKEASYRLALLLRKVLILVTPKQSISLQEIDGLAEMVSQSFSTTDRMTGSSTVATAALSITRQVLPRPANEVIGTASLFSDDSWVLPESAEHNDDNQTSLTSSAESSTVVFRIERERIKARHAGSIVQTLLPVTNYRASSTDLTWTDWKLFDGRFWIRLRYRPFNLSPNRSIIVRFLEKKDIETVRRTSPVGARYMDAQLKRAAPGKARFTLPVIIERYETVGEKGTTEVREDVLALPTVDWGNLGWRPWKDAEDAGETDGGVSWRWECRYKTIDFGTGPGHTMKSPRLRSKA